MRAYFFGNMYLSTIQQGIQAAHAVADMFVKYDRRNRNLAEMADYSSPNCNQWQILLDWADCHKTIILLNAGYGQEIHNLVTFFSKYENPFPWAPFRESHEALDGALTTVGIVLPEEIYGAAKELRTAPGYVTGKGGKGMMYNEYELSEYEFQLAQRINNYELAH